MLSGALDSSLTDAFPSASVGLVKVAVESVKQLLFEVLLISAVFLRSASNLPCARAMASLPRGFGINFARFFLISYAGVVFEVFEASMAL
jgi:hypothetical protein